MAIKKFVGGTVITGQDIEWFAYAAAFGIAKLDFKHGIKFGHTRAAWARLATVCRVPYPTSRQQKQRIFDAVAPNFPAMAGAQTFAHKGETK